MSDKEDRKPTVYYLGVRTEPKTREEAKRFCCNTGSYWEPMIETILDIIEYQYEDFAIQQVKEKMGELRFYCTGGKPREFPETPYRRQLLNLNDVIESMTMLSRKICIQCGKLGKIRYEGWATCLCDECSESQ